MDSGRNCLQVADVPLHEDIETDPNPRLVRASFASVAAVLIGLPFSSKFLAVVFIKIKIQA